MNKFDRIVSRKPSYKMLTENEKRIKKLHERKELLEKFFYAPLSGFYKRAPRLKNGQVDWDSLTEKEKDSFDYFFKELEQVNNKLNKFPEDEIEKILSTFNQVNNKSVSF